VIDFRVNAVNQYADYVRANSGMAGLGSTATYTADGVEKSVSSDGGSWLGSVGSFLGNAVDKLSPLAVAVWDAKSKTASEKNAQKQILLQNKNDALKAQQAAMDIMAKREYAAQVAAIQAEQNRISMEQSDTVLMIGGITLAALVMAKLLKVI